MSTDNPQVWDLRVRERNIAEGKLGEKELAKYLTGLPDLADQIETFATPQPALDAPELDEVDDEDDEDDSDNLDGDDADGEGASSDAAAAEPADATEG